MLLLSFVSRSAAPANDRRLALNQTGKRRAVVVIRGRNGNSLPAVFRAEGQALSFIKARIAKGTTVHAEAIAEPVRGTGDARGAKLIMITDAGRRAVEREGLIPPGGGSGS